MKYLVQLMIIFAITLLGTILSTYLPIPIPGSILGGIILFIFLMTGIIKKEQIGDTASFLIKHFSLFFIPSAVLFLGVYNDIVTELFLFVLIVLISTILTFLVSTYTVKLCNKWQKKHKKEVNGNVIN